MLISDLPKYKDHHNKIRKGLVIGDKIRYRPSEITYIITAKIRSGLVRHVCLVDLKTGEEVYRVLSTRLSSIRLDDEIPRDLLVKLIRCTSLDAWELVE